MRGRVRGLVAAAAALAVSLGGVAVGAPAGPAPGASGAGDAYFPLDGNGGYDVARYLLDLRYDPGKHWLAGTTQVSATATHDLSRFDLDLVGLTVRAVTVDGRAATWTRRGQELVVTPPAALAKGVPFVVRVRYDGRPAPEDGDFGDSGVLRSPTGVAVMGEPHVAASWFPASDHPSDKASYSFRIRVPTGYTAVANGALTGRQSAAGTTTWRWDAVEPMASYLATMSVGKLALSAYTKGGLQYWDAVDADSLRRLKPRTGSQFALSAGAKLSTYRRLIRTLKVPARGAKLSFWVDRDQARRSDARVFVEAHTAGRGDWTTLRDLRGHTRGKREPCPDLSAHPFLRHYLTPAADYTCTPRGSTGRWWAADGTSRGYERWRVDLAAFAGRTVEVAITTIGNGDREHPGVAVDDITVLNPGGVPAAGSTSFEPDAAPRDGWRLERGPRGNFRGTRTWAVGGAGLAARSLGERARAALALQPAMITFLAGRFGPYPFRTAGATVVDVPVGFAMETQTRSTYPTIRFADPVDGEAVVVHELAHQWFGNSVTLRRWRHLWLNEGFARYAEWLWSEHRGRDSAQEQFRYAYSRRPADDPFWTVRIGAPGAKTMFTSALYERGGMTLHQLRVRIGDGDFFTLLRRWAAERAGGHGTSAQFRALAEEVSGADLDAFFERWLMTPSRPAVSSR